MIAPRTPGMLDPAAVMRIRHLELRARAVVEGFWHGLHRSPHHGFSVEFTEYRPYTTGDDPRYIDWRLVARTDRFFIKKFEDETNLRCHLLVDHSRSMSYGSGSYVKTAYADTLAATFGYFLGQQGDAVGLLVFDEGVREYLPARHRPGHLRQLMLTLEKPPMGTGTDITAPLRRMAELTRKRGLMVLLSDFLTPLATLEPALGLLRAAGHEILVFHLVDPGEETFPFTAAGRFVDLESGREVALDPVAMRPEYVRRFAEHGRKVQAACERLGISYARLRTDEPLEHALHGFIQTRQGRKRVRRR